MVHLTRLFRWALLIGCVAFCVIKSFEAINEYREQKNNIATKVSLENLEANFSRFNVAFCVDKYKVFKTIKAGANSTLTEVKDEDDDDEENEFEYDEYEYDEGWDPFDCRPATDDGGNATKVDLYRDIYSPNATTVTVRFSDGSKKELVTGYEIYHPVQGECLVAEMSGLPKGKVVTSVEAKVRPQLDNLGPSLDCRFEDEYGDYFDEDEGGKNETAQRRRRRRSANSGGGRSRLEEEAFGDGVRVSIFVPGQMYLTQVDVFTRTGMTEEVNLSQDVTDKSAVDRVPGEECSKDPSAATGEDACLEDCLVTRFIAERACVHKRLRTWMSYSAVNVAKAIWDAVPNCEKNDTRRSLGISGKTLIDNILKSFGTTNNLEDRCGCPRPCVRRYFQISRWLQKNDTEKPHDLKAVILHKPRFHFYRDYRTFDFKKLLADIGGYLGLMLGYCVYSVANLVDYLWGLYQAKKTAEEEQEMQDAKGNGTVVP